VSATTTATARPTSLWQNTNGIVAEWQMEGATIATSAVIGSVTSEWVAQNNHTATLAHT
jgi:hypothetical protein